MASGLLAMGHDPYPFTTALVVLLALWTCLAAALAWLYLRLAATFRNVEQERSAAMVRLVRGMETGDERAIGEALNVLDPGWSARDAVMSERLPGWPKPDGREAS